MVVDVVAATFAVAAVTTVTDTFAVVAYDVALANDVDGAGDGDACY